MDQLKNRKISKKIVLAVLAVLVVCAGIGMAVSSLKTNPDLEDAGLTALKKGSGAITKDENRKQRLIAAVDTIDGTLNPAFATAAADRMACELIYEPLAYVNTDGSYDMVLAESVDWNPENLTMTIRLKDGILFSDGTPVTADDVCASIGIRCLAAYNLDDNGPYFHIKGVWDMNEQKTTGISGIQKVDERTVAVAFLDGYVQNREIVETMIQKNGFAEVGTQLECIKNIEDYYNKGIGTGPYMLETSSGGITTCLQANPNYREEIKDIKKVEFTLVNFYDMEKAVTEQNVDVIQYTANSEQFDTIYNARQFDVYKKPADQIYAIGFNANNIFLKDYRIRQAIAYAFNKEKALNKDWSSRIAPTDVIGYGDAKMTGGFEGNAISYDKGKADDLMKETSMKGRIILRFPVLKDNDFQMHLSSCIKEDLEAVGFTVDIRECTSEEYVRSLYVEDTFDIYLYNDIMNYDFKTFDSMTQLRDGMPVAYRDNDYVELVNKLQSAMDQTEYQAVLTELSAKFYEMVPVIPFGQVQKYLSVSRDLSGYGAAPDSLFLDHVNQMRSNAK